MEAEEVRVVITTSRYTSKKIQEFLNDLQNSLPRVKKIVRGKKSLTTLVEEALANGARYLALVTSRRGTPATIKFADVDKRIWKYVVILAGVKTRSDLPVFVHKRERAKSAAIVDYDGGELVDIFTEVFGYAVYKDVDLDEVKFYDTIVVIRGDPKRDWDYVVELIDGRDFGPRPPLMRIKAFLCTRSQLKLS